MGIYLGLHNGRIGFHFLLYRRKKRLLKIIQRGGCPDPADVRLRAAPDPADVRLRAVGLPTPRMFHAVPLVWICNPDPLSIRIFNPKQ